MSKITNNPLLKGVSGKFADVVVYREVRGKMIMSNKPKPPKTISERQLATRAKFQRASLYAQRQLESPEMKALYEKGISSTKFTAYMVALTDYLKAPVIHAVDATGYRGSIGDGIAIRASDDFRVQSVQVSITDAAGTVIEQGQAQLQQDAVDDFRYIATAAHPQLPGTKLSVSVRDTAGNVTVAEQIL